MVIVAYGPTQSGKSATLGALRTPGQPMPRVGDGDGESVTDKTHLFSAVVGPVLDTRGIDDSRLRFTDDEAGRHVAIGIADSRETSVKFLVFESMGNDSMRLRGTLEKLARAFGQSAYRATLVLVTKVDLQPDSTTLQEALRRFPGIVPADLEDLESRTRARAKQLCAAHPTQCRTVTVDVEEQYTVPRQEKVPYTEHYISHETEQETYFENVPQEVVKPILVK